MKELATKLVKQTKHGDRFIVQNIEENDFHEKAKAFKEAVEARGFAIGAVYYRPIKTGMIFIR